MIIYLKSHKNQFLTLKIPGVKRKVCSNLYEIVNNIVRNNCEIMDGYGDITY